MARPISRDRYEVERGGHRPAEALFFSSEVAARPSSSSSADGTRLWLLLADPMRMMAHLESCGDKSRLPTVAPSVDMTKLLPLMPCTALSGVEDQTPRPRGALVIMEQVDTAAAERNKEVVCKFRAATSDMDRSILMSANRLSVAELGFSGLLWGAAAVAGVAATVFIWRM